MFLPGDTFLLSSSNFNEVKISAGGLAQSSIVVLDPSYMTSCDCIRLLSKLIIEDEICLCQPTGLFVVFMNF